jgi:O-antigen ligase
MAPLGKADAHLTLPAMRLPALHSSFALLCTLVLSGAVGTALALEQAPAAAALALAPAVALALGRLVGAATRVPFGIRLLAVAWLLLLCSTFVWRLRTTSQLNVAPLDRAAWLRIALVATGGLLALMVLSSRHHPVRIPFPIAALAVYVGISLVAALASPSPFPEQALYRSLELAVGLAAVVATLAVMGRRAGSEMLRMLVGAIGLILAVVWLEALLVPSRAWLESGGPFPYTLQGALPRFESNTVGMLGGLLAVWGLATLVGDRGPSWLPRLALLGGFATLAASQYRTGIIGFFLAAGVVLWQKRRFLLTLGAATAVVTASLLGVAGDIGSRGEDAFSKGQSPRVIQTLNSRTVYWTAAKPMIEERPALGWGLNVGSRQALASIGIEGTSTIANTWVEALIGTGALGAAALALAFGGAFQRAWRNRSQSWGLVATGMLLFLFVRSLTGTTFELFGIGFLVFAALALVPTERRRPAEIS